MKYRSVKDYNFTSPCENVTLHTNGVGDFYSYIKNKFSI